MNWGNLLLDGFWGEVSDVLATIWDSINNIFETFLYWIWEALAHVVGYIERIFRNLAGLGDGDNNDLVSQIITNKNVGRIFGNLVGVCTAVIVFFTIVKILQDHYKDKEGGNPYKIVLRTFKGLLMFFFVNAAVTVGLMATRTMFRALDAATGSGGTASVAGQVFKAMVAGDSTNPGANRKRIGIVSNDGAFGAEHFNKFYYRMAPEQAATYGRYVMVDMTNSSTDPLSTSELQSRYVELFPDTQYGIVSEDGKTVTPLSQWVTTFEGEEDEDPNPYEGAFNEWKDDYLVGEKTGNGFQAGENGVDFNASVGYKSDILRHISTTVQPSIDLTWSPIDIYNYGFSLYETEVMKHDIDTSVMGTGTVIPMSTTFVRYGDPIVTMKSMEDSAKMFGISINGKVALQGGEASASFSVDAFDNQFGDILYTILSNVLYTNLTQMLVQAIPAFPASTSIYTFKINYLQMLAPLIMKIFQATNESIMNAVGFIPKDKNGQPLAETFVINPSSHNSNIWVSVNDKSKYVPIVIEKYQIDGNFTDLWSQLVDSYNDFIEDCEDAETETWNRYESNAAALQNMSGKLVEEQQGWAKYKGLVDRYNNVVKNNLPELAKQLSLYKEMTNSVPGLESDPENSTANANDFLAQKGFSGSVETLETSIKGKFRNMVAHYIDASAIYSNAKPSSSYADPIVVPSIYKPAIEFSMTTNYADSLTVQEIYDTLFNLDKKNYVKVNMVFDNTAAYRMIDWNSYPGVNNTYRAKFNQYADFYVDPVNDSNKVPDVENQNTPVLKNTSLADLAFINIPSQVTTWQDQGINYFRTNETGAGNPFLVNHGKTFHNNAFWGERGISVDGIRYYQEYTGTVPTPNLGLDHGFTDVNTSSLSTMATNNVRTRASSASINSIMASSKKALSTELATMADVDTTTPLATEFAENIVTIRRLGSSASQQSKDVKALKSWFRFGHSAGPKTDDYEAKQLTGASADEIDDLFAASGSPRRYLMRTKDGQGLNDERDNLAYYYGVMSYADLSAVKQIYDINKINFVIGYIGLVTALGVYMNFAFGLIQRAVNMTVLYVMSPVTIAFYPFDDGSKFSSQFVTPFYKEALSAFSVILSLNLFIVFLQPVQSAVGAVTGSAALGWLGLVAFVSMLPQIRNKIEGVLGAGGLAQKSLGQMWNDAKKATGLDKVGGAAKNIARATGLSDKMKAFGEERVKGLLNHFDKQEAKKGKLNWLERTAKNALTGNSERQKRIDQAIADGTTDKLTGLDKRVFERQQKAAKKKAEEALKGKEFASDAEREAAIKEEQNKLMNDKTFKRSHRGLSNVKRVLNKPVNALKGLGKKVADSGVGAAAKYMFGEGSLAGELARSVFGHDGMFAKNEKSVLGAFIRMKNPITRMDNMKKATESRRAYASAKAAYKEDFISGATNLADKIEESEKVIEKAKTEELYRRHLAEKSDKEKLKNLLIAQNIASGKSEEDAEKEAEKTIKKYQKEKKDLSQEYNLQGGDQKLIDGFVGDVKEFRGLSLSLNLEDKEVKQKLLEIEQNLRAKIQLGKGAIETELANENKVLDAGFKVSANAILSSMNIEANEENVKSMVNILKDTYQANPTGEAPSDELAKTIAKTFNVKNADAAKIGEHYTEMTKARIQSQNTIAELEVAKEAAALIAKGEEMFSSKLGDDVSSYDKQAIMETFRNVYDKNYSSTNTNSLGYKLNQILQEYNGDMEAARPAMEKVESEMKAKLDREMKLFGDKYANSIRRHGIAKKYTEEMNAVETMSIMTEIQHRREYHIGTQMDTPSIQTIVADSLIQDMHAKGDYSGAGLKLQQLVDCIQRHDYDQAYELKFDRETVDKLKEWEEQGKTARLNGIRGLGEFDAAYMSSGYTAMGGTSLMGMEAALAQLTSVAEKNILISKFEAALGDAASRETDARAEVSQFLNQIDATFSGSMWQRKEVVDAIREKTGKVFEDAASFTKYLADTMDDVNYGRKKKTDEDVKKLMDAFNEVQNQFVGKPGFESLTDAAKMFNNTISRAEEANMWSARQDEYNHGINSFRGQLQEIMAKIKAFSGGK